MVIKTECWTTESPQKSLRMGLGPICVMAARRPGLRERPRVETPRGMALRRPSRAAA